MPDAVSIYFRPAGGPLQSFLQRLVHAGPLKTADYGIGDTNSEGGPRPKTPPRPPPPAPPPPLLPPPPPPGMPGMHPPALPAILSNPPDIPMPAIAPVIVSVNFCPILVARFVTALSTGVSSVAVMAESAPLPNSKKALPSLANGLPSPDQIAGDRLGDIRCQRTHCRVPLAHEILRGRGLFHLSCQAPRLKRPYRQVWHRLSS